MSKQELDKRIEELEDSVEWRRQEGYPFALLLDCIVRLKQLRKDLYE